MSFVQTKPGSAAAASETPRAPSSELLPRAVSSPSRFLFIVAALFAAHIFIRLFTSPLADLDESEQLVFTQTYEWGYGPQPPLYTWLQTSLFRLFGPSLFALALLKNVLLFGIYAFTYAATKRLTRQHVTAVVASISLMFIPQIAWESQRDLTHSVLATTLAAATLFVFLQLTESNARRPLLYPLLGICFALGILSNYNYALFVTGLLVASICVKEFRALVLTPWILLSLIIAAAITWPHWIWVRDHAPLVMATTHKLRIQPSASFINVAFNSVRSLAGAWLSHIISLVLVFLVLCWKQLVPFPRAVCRRPAFLFLFALLAAALAGVAVTMLAKHATSFKGRWLQPLYVCVPMLFALLIEPRLTRVAVRRLLMLASSLALFIVIALPLRIRFADEMKRDEPLNAPLRQLTSALREPIAQSDFIIADDFFLGGNFRLIYPSKTVWTPAFTPATSGKSCVIAFDATSDMQPPEALAQLIQTKTKRASSSLPWVFVQAHHARGQPMRVGYARITLE